MVIANNVDVATIFNYSTSALTGTTTSMMSINISSLGVSVKNNNF